MLFRIGNAIVNLDHVQALQFSPAGPSLVVSFATDAPPLSWSGPEAERAWSAACRVASVDMLHAYPPEDPEDHDIDDLDLDLDGTAGLDGFRP